MRGYLVGYYYYFGLLNIRMHVHARTQFISRINGEELSVDEAIEIINPKAEGWIQKFDEHTIDKCHKFGIIYQKKGQVYTLTYSLAKTSP